MNMDQTGGYPHNVLAYDGTIEGWLKALDLRDQRTMGHSYRVTYLSVKLAVRLGLDEQMQRHIRRGALLHDIGKLGVPDSILNKIGTLSEQEMQIIRRHPTYGYQMMVHIPYLEIEREIVYAHHEHWDGSGYPRGLQGEEIPLAARIVAVADVWDDLNTNALGLLPEMICARLQREAGRRFDPHILAAFLDLLQEEHEQQIARAAGEA